MLFWILSVDIQDVLDAGCTFILQWFVIIQLLLNGKDYSRKIGSGHEQNSAGVPLVFQNNMLYMWNGVQFLC
jgi:hypothetical protein